MGCDAPSTIHPNKWQWESREPTTLIYAEPVGFDEVPFLATYPKRASPHASKKERKSHPAMHSFASNATRHDGYAYYGSAPLSNVTRVEHYYQILPFNERKLKVIQGFIFHYSNGGRRALGSVRVGVGLSETIVNPTHLTIVTWRINRRSALNGPALVVLVTADDIEPIPPNGEAPRSYLVMAGELEFWYRLTDECVIEIKDRRDSPVGALKKSYRAYTEVLDEDK